MQYKEAAKNIKNRFKNIFSKKTFSILPKEDNSMLGAGYMHKGKRLITHTSLHYENSALRTFLPWQILAMIIIVSSILIGLITHPLAVAITVLGLLSFIYFADTIFNLYLILRSLYFPPEINFSSEKIRALDDEDLPIYTILCPLYREVKVLPAFLQNMDNLDWPKDKLEVILLLEENDMETQQAALALQPPFYVRTVIVPHSEPKTKPKACNYGLNFANGEYLVIYDAEDRPDPDQLKKAYLGFLNSKANIACLQAKLNYYNPHQNLLTRLFTAEYSLWFDIMLTGLQTINTAIPLGGTSNHFRTKVLKELQGWDPFNVTEDCDLGIRLFKKGYKTAVIDSTTWEEANSNFKNWLRQRSRWIKGYFQTFFVHNRHPITFIKEQGIHALIFQLIIGARMSFMLINPFLWVMTISYFALYQYVGPTIESFYPGVVFYMAVFSLIVGNFLYLYNYMIGVAKRGQWTLMKFVFLVPFYWLMASIAASIAFYQLLTKPHYWEKTIHGLHLKTEEIAEIAQEVLPETVEDVMKGEPFWGFPRRIRLQLQKLIGEKEVFLSGAILVLSNLMSSFFYFVLNTYLGRKLSFEDYGELSLFTSFLFIASIVLNALSSTVSHKVAYLYGKYSKGEAKGYLNQVLPFILISSVILSFAWLVLIPVLKTFFHYDSYLPFIFFTPIWASGLLWANYSGFLKGILSFYELGVIALAEALVKLGGAILLINLGLQDYIVLIFPISMFTSLSLCWKASTNIKHLALPASESGFNKPFFTAATLSGISTVSFLGVDIILAKHFLSPLEAGQYGILSLVGKMIYFGASLFIPFIIPIVARNEGAGKSSQKAFLLLLGLTGFIICSAFVVLGIFGDVFVPFLFGSKSLSILSYLDVYLLGIGLYAISRPIVQYYQAKKNYIFTIPGILLCLMEIILLFFFHNNLNQFVRMIFYASAFHTITILVVFLLKSPLASLVSNLKDLQGLLYLQVTKRRSSKESLKGLRILIFNWRDTKHVWSGGAESYVHELAKRWVTSGNQVTLFCGNDGQSLRNEVIDGVSIIRRGGFYTVYIWACLYYLRFFRGHFDVIIDSENGLPFFTPLYTRKPKFLLIHHIHQEVFHEHLKFPLSYIAMFLLVKNNYVGSEKEIYQSSKKLFWPYIGLTLLTTLFILLWTCLLIIPGIIFSILYSFAVYVLFFEDKKGMAAIKRSVQLVKHYWWAVFGRFCLFGLVIWLFMLIISIPVGLTPENTLMFSIWNAIVQVINMLIGPIALLFSYRIYQDLVKIKK